MSSGNLSDKFVNKYMRQAKQLGEDKNPCYSRQIGVVLVKVYENGDSRIVSTGYNGPPKKTPHCDTQVYLENIVWPQLSREERNHALGVLGFDPEDCHKNYNNDGKQYFLDNATGCKTCPRRLIGAASGERTELCSCEHAERNAIYNATDDLHGAWAFCWCGVACWDCTKAMCNVGISRCYFIDDASYSRADGPDYSFGSRWLFKKRGVEILICRPEVYLAS